MISSITFSLYINDFIKSLKSKGHGCFQGDIIIYAGCLLFADDILLLSASRPIVHLKSMLNVCYSYYDNWDINFNVNKPNVIVVGKDDDIVLPVMKLGAI